MKNKRKSILAIFIIFFVILSFSYYTNAAETLKAAQDKYRISYNNFMKAIKEGADQERIDQLSVQCKEDYAEYQKIAKSKNVSINKPSTPQTKPAGTTVPKVDSQSTNIPIKQKILIPQNKKFVKTIKPSQPTQIKLARITDNEYALGEISKLPPEINEIKDAVLKDKITNIYNNASNGKYVDIYKFCNNEYPNVSDLCGLARLYYIQAEIKKDTSFVSYDRLAYLEEIKNFYKDYKTPITEYIVAEIDKMIPKITENNNAKIKIAIEEMTKATTRYNDYVKFILDKDNKISYTQIQETKSTIRQLRSQTDNACFNVAYSLSQAGDYKGLKTLITNYKNNFYDNMKWHYDVNCIRQDGSISTEKIYLNKNSDVYFNLLDRHFSAYLKYAETNDNGEDIFNKVTGKETIENTEIDNIDKFISRIQAPLKGDEENNKAEEEKISDYQINTYKEKMNSFKKQRVVEKIYFTKYENIKIMPSYEAGGIPFSYEMPSPNDLICVRCTVKDDGTGEDAGPMCLYPIKLKLKSSVSNRERSIIVKKTSFYGYGKQIQLVTDPTSTESEKCLIKSHGGDSKTQFQHTVSVVDGVEQLLQIPDPDIDYFKVIKEKSFLKEWLGSALFTKQLPDPIDTVIASSESISTMGFETVFASTINNTTTNFFTIKNQADWCVIAAHGSATGDLTVTSKRIESENARNIAFDSIKVVPNNVSFLLLISCDLLNIPLNKYKITSETLDIIKQSSGIKWCKKMTGNVSILGYSETIRPVSKILGNFFENIKPSVSYPYSEKFKEFVVDQWLETHLNFYQEQAKAILAQYPERPPKEELEDLVETADVINGILSAKSIYNEWYHELTIDNNYDLSCYGMFNLHMNADLVITNLNLFL